MRYSMFIGRYQPFHKGHKTLVEQVLKEGKNVLIAIRDTEIDDKNPFSAGEREEIIRGMMAEYGDRVKVIVIPDIEEVCYGREVGWGIREIRLDAETEAISATKIRQGGLNASKIGGLTHQSSDRNRIPDEGSGDRG